MLTTVSSACRSAFLQARQPFLVGSCLEQKTLEKMQSALYLQFDWLQFLQAILLLALLLFLRSAGLWQTERMCVLGVKCLSQLPTIVAQQTLVAVCSAKRCYTVHYHFPWIKTFPLFESRLTVLFIYSMFFMGMIKERKDQKTALVFATDRLHFQTQLQPHPNVNIKSLR